MTSKPATLISTEIARLAAGASRFQMPSSRMPSEASGMTSTPVLNKPSSLAFLLSVSTATVEGPRSGWMTKGSRK